MTKTLTWSHTSLKEFETCARKYHVNRVLKLYPYKETEATQEGNEFHKAMEDAIRDKVPLPEKYKKHRPLLDAMLLKPGRKMAEIKMGATRNLDACDFFAKDVWVRGVADLLIVDDEDLKAWVVDWKTGKNKYPDLDQLTLMSLLVFAKFPHIRQVNSALVFVNYDDLRKKRMFREQAEQEWWKYRERTGRIEAAAAADQWHANPGPLCGWCEHIACEHHPKH